MPQVKERPREIDEDTTEDTGKREISKVKYDGSRVEIHHYWTDGKKDSATSIFTSQDQPASSFLDAQQALLDEVLFICELPEEYADNMEVRGISIGNGAVITAVKKFPELGNKALCINTPHMMFSDSIRDDDKSSVPLPTRTAEAVKNWAKEAEAFLNGKRHANQLSLAVNNEKA